MSGRDGRLNWMEPGMVFLDAAVVAAVLGSLRFRTENLVRVLLEWDGMEFLWFYPFLFLFFTKKTDNRENIVS